MILNNESAKKVAQSLLQIKAIKLQPNQPFTWASGWNSPIYCDNRKILSYPKVRTFIRQQFVEAIKEHYPKVEVIAGVATGGIAIGALVAEEMGLPFVYIRSAAKGHGLQNLIEGEVPTDKNVVVIEDLISTGGSSLTAVAALKQENCNVLGMVAIFTYDFETAKENFKAAQCPLVTLSDYNVLIATAEADSFISANDVASLSEWRKDPAGWRK
ncbi:MAG: orotate phosphoribosyltransferase [Flavobacteriales bacterium]|nr:orotate phosphoribosyltransferase [Flavobacteriales bacterium]